MGLFSKSSSTSPKIMDGLSEEAKRLAAAGAAKGVTPPVGATAAAVAAAVAPASPTPHAGAARSGIFARPADGSVPPPPAPISPEQAAMIAPPPRHADSRFSSTGAAPLSAERQVYFQQ